MDLMRERYDRQLMPTTAFDETDLRRMWAHYCGAVSYVDHCLGLVLEALIDTDQFDDTLFVFTSDHGEMLGSHGMLLKGSVLFEELMRVPLLVHSPDGTPGGRVSDQLVSHVDLVSTMLARCGIEPPGDLHGVDIGGLLQGDDDRVRQGLAFEFHSSNWGERPTPLRGWRTEQWKYIESIDGAEELYDLEANPGERRNLVDAAGAQPALSRVRSELRTWIEGCGDSWPVVPTSEREVPWEHDDRWGRPPRGPTKHQRQNMLRAGTIGCGGITERRHGPVLATLKDRVHIAALQAGAHVLLEKPLCTSLPEADRMIAAGAKAVRAYAQIGRHVQDIEVEDMALVLIEHGNAATTSVQVGWCFWGGGVGVKEIYGTKGQIRLGGQHGTALWHKDAQAWESIAVEEEEADRLGFPTVVQNFIAAIETGGEVPVRAEDSRHVLAIVLAAYESGRSGKAVDIV